MPLKVTMHHTVITKREKKLIKILQSHRCLSTVIYNTRSGQMMFAPRLTEPLSKGELLLNKPEKPNNNNLV